VVVVVAAAVMMITIITPQYNYDHNNTVDITGMLEKN
jgi:hypothetical protein